MSAYIQAARRAEWTGYSLAAQSVALQQLEMARSAKWDPQGGVNEIVQMSTNNIVGLDVPSVSKGQAVYATNYLTIKNVPVSVNPTSSVLMVRVSTVWPLRRGTQIISYTNTVASYFAPDR